MSGLAHTDDPWTSHNAVAKLDAVQRASLKVALIQLLHEEGPMTGDQLTSSYQWDAKTGRWPLMSDSHNIKRRLSELVRHHGVVRSTGEHSLSAHGRPALLWELSMPLDQAREAIK